MKNPVSSHTLLAIAVAGLLGSASAHAAVSNDWDIINLSFAEPTSVNSGDLRASQ